MEDLAHLFCMLSDLKLMCQASRSEPVLFDFLPFHDDGLVPSEVNVCWSHIPEAFVIAMMVVVADKGLDLGFKAPGGY